MNILWKAAVNFLYAGCVLSFLGLAPSAYADSISVDDGVSVLRKTLTAANSYIQERSFPRYEIKEGSFEISTISKEKYDGSVEISIPIFSVGASIEAEYENSSADTFSLTIQPSKTSEISYSLEDKIIQFIDTLSRNQDNSEFPITISKFSSKLSFTRTASGEISLIPFTKVGAESLLSTATEFSIVFCRSEDERGCD